MNITERLLKQLSEWPPTAERQTLRLVDDPTGNEAMLTVDRQESLGAMVWELTVRRSPDFPSTGQTLGLVAERLALAVTGLREPLKVVEVDPQRNEALLRSHDPEKRDAAVSYFEIVVKGRGAGVGDMLLRRYQASTLTGSKRRQTAFPATHETIAKIAGDFLAAGQ